MKPLAYMSFVTIFILTACNNNGDKKQLLNEKASLPTSFNFSSRGLKFMSSLINKKSGITSVLYANPVALKNIKNANPIDGEVLVLVNWKQQDDRNWFGGKIPGKLQTVEMVSCAMAHGKPNIVYEKYLGTSLLIDADTLRRQERIKYIFNQYPSIIP